MTVYGPFWDKFKGPYSADEYEKLLKQLGDYNNVSVDLISSFVKYLRPIYQLDQQNVFGKPMPWIGMYIATASSVCILAMAADLLHGFRNKKGWFPNKYFTLNAASLTVIAVAMKLPVDLNNPMPGVIDKRAKIGSLAFMCTMMASLLPSLATMDGKELVTNMIALGILVVTLVVNVCIQIKTSVINTLYVDIYLKDPTDIRSFALDEYDENSYLKIVAAIYVGMLLLLLIIYMCSALAIVKSKQMLESKYQQVHETTSIDGTSSVEKVKEHVRCYWMMAGTGSPQFMIASFPTTTTSGVICVISTILYIPHVRMLVPQGKPYKDSCYEWSILVIFAIQFMGVILGTIAPISRCFTSLNFKLSKKLIWNLSKVFKVDSYWTQNLCDWKHNSVGSSFNSRIWKIVIENLKIILLNICIGLQNTFVVAFKMISLIPAFVVICVWCCSYCWRSLKSMFSASGTVLGQNAGQVEQTENLRRYALQIQDDIEVADRKLKDISGSLNRLVQRAEKKQPVNLMRLLTASGDFKKVGKYDNHHVSRLISEDYLDCWSLPLVTLTTIAISLPEIETNIVTELISTVNEGFVYVRLVEEILNASDEYISTQKAAKLLWPKVELNHEWCDIRLRRLDPQLKTSEQILKWFIERAESIVNDVEHQNIGYQNEKSNFRLISADSMYRITTTILLSNENTINKVSQRELYEQLSSMISGIFAACLTNLPRVIMMKCHTNEIEKREASVHVAAQLLGETMQIINYLEDHERPSLNPDELAFIGKWCAYYNHPSP